MDAGGDWTLSAASSPAAGSPASGFGRGPGDRSGEADYRERAARLLLGIQRSANAIGRGIANRAVGQIEQAVAAINQVGAKLSKEASRLYEGAAAVVPRVESRVELDALNSLSLATQIAASAGVVPWTPADLEGRQPSFPASYSPVPILHPAPPLAPPPAQWPEPGVEAPGVPPAGLTPQTYPPTQQQAAAAPGASGPASLYGWGGTWPVNFQCPAGLKYDGYGYCIAEDCQAMSRMQLDGILAQFVDYKPRNLAPAGWAADMESWLQNGRWPATCFKTGSGPCAELDCCDEATGQRHVYFPKDSPAGPLQGVAISPPGSTCSPVSEPDCREECVGEDLHTTCSTPGGASTTVTQGAAECAPPPPPPPPCCPQQPDVNITNNVDARLCGDEECKYELQAQPAPAPKKLTSVDWDKPDPCGQVDRALDANAAEFNDFVAGLLPDGLFDEAEPDIDAMVEKKVGGMPGFLKAPIGVALYGFYRSMRTSFLQLHRGTGCDDAALIKPILAKAAMQWGQRLFGIDVSDATTRINYGIHAKCPTEIPSVPNLHAMYNAGEISADDWECLVKANNRLPELARKELRTSWVKPGILDVISLWRRKLIDDVELTRRLQKLGVRGDGDREAFVKLTEVIPPYTDIIRLMTRDAFNEQVVARFEYNKEFDESYPDRAKEWANGQGISDDVMRYIWRAHWRLPAPGQAFSMLHRNRPGRVAADEVVEVKDVEDLLKIDDLAPWWRKRLIKISYGVMRLVDIRKQFNFGQMDKKELVEQLQDRSYDKATAERHANAMEKEKTEWVKGQYTPKQYVAGLATREELQEALVQYKLEDGEIGQLIGQLDYRKRLDVRKRCMAGIKKRYMTGEFPADVATGHLIGLGIDPQEASSRVSSWECERASKGKEVTAQMLCDWVGKGLLSLASMRERLINIGFRESDAERIMRACQIALAEKALKAQQRTNDARGRQQKAEDRARSTGERERQREEGKRQGASRQADLAAEKVKLKLLKLARKWAAYKGIPDEEVWQDLEDKVCELRTRKGYSLDGAANIVTEIVLAAIGAGEPTYLKRWLRVTASMPSLPQSDLACAAGS